MTGCGAFLSILGWPTMPPGDDADYERALRDVVADLSRQLGVVREQLRGDVTEAIARQREDHHRAIMGIQSRLVQGELREDADRKERKERQHELDQRLDRQDGIVEQQNRILERQNGVLSEHTATLSTQNAALDDISRRAKWRTLLELATFVAVVVIVATLFYVFR